MKKVAILIILILISITLPKYLSAAPANGLEANNLSAPSVLHQGESTTLSFQCKNISGSQINGIASQITFAFTTTQGTTDYGFVPAAARVNGVSIPFIYNTISPYLTGLIYNTPLNDQESVTFSFDVDQSNQDTPGREIRLTAFCVTTTITPQLNSNDATMVISITDPIVQPAPVPVPTPTPQPAPVAVPVAVTPQSIDQPQDTNKINDTVKTEVTPASSPVVVNEVTPNVEGVNTSNSNPGQNKVILLGLFAFVLIVLGLVVTEWRFRLFSKLISKLKK